MLFYVIYLPGRRPETGKNSYLVGARILYNCRLLLLFLNPVGGGPQGVGRDFIIESNIILICPPGLPSNASSAKPTDFTVSVFYFILFLLTERVIIIAWRMHHESTADRWPGGANSGNSATSLRRQFCQLLLLLFLISAVCRRRFLFQTLPNKRNIFIFIHCIHEGISNILNI